jgi:hypothetical protein
MSLSLILLGPAARAELCPYWSGEEQAGLLPSPPFSEVSGMAASKKYPGRLYIVNDSGDGGRLYVYETATGDFKAVKLRDFPGYDIEAVSVGACGEESCVYIGDIGDNGKRRKIIRVGILREKRSYDDSVSLLHHKILRYPEEVAHDAEAMIVTSKGDLYLFSKEFGWPSSEPTSLFKISYRELKREGRSTLEARGKLRMQGLPFLNPLLTVTDASLSADESSLLLMTYTQSFEVSFEELEKQAAGPESLVELPYGGFGLRWMVQSEAGTYLHPTRNAVWTYESGAQPAALIQRRCPSL